MKTLLLILEKVLILMALAALAAGHALDRLAQRVERRLILMEMTQ